MEMLLRILVFVVAFTFGAYVASFFRAPEFRMSPPALRVRIDDSGSYVAKPNSGVLCPAAGPGINILYNGWEPGAAGKAPFLSFVLCNDSDETLDYSAEYPTHVFTTADQRNVFATASADKVLPGLIHARSIAEFRIYLDENFKKPINANQFTIKLLLGRPGVRGLTYYRSEQFDLPNGYH